MAVSNIIAVVFNIWKDSMLCFYKLQHFSFNCFYPLNYTKNSHNFFFLDLVKGRINIHENDVCAAYAEMINSLSQDSQGKKCLGIWGILILGGVHHNPQSLRNPIEGTNGYFQSSPNVLY